MLYQIVSIQSLSQRPDLNGKKGRLVKKINAKRWEVQVDGYSTTVAVKSSNLACVEAQTVVNPMSWAQCSETVVLQGWKGELDRNDPDFFRRCKSGVYRCLIENVFEVVHTVNKPGQPGYS